MFTVLGAALVAAALVGIAAHYVDSTRQIVLVAGALARVLMIAALPGTVLLGIGLGPMGAAAGVVVIGVALRTQLPLLRHRRRRPDSAGTPLSVLHANILLGQADPDAIVALVDEHASDVLTVVELTPSAHERLVAAGLRRRLPYEYVSTAPGGNGTGIYSRHPMSDEERHDGYITELLSARIGTPTGPSPLVFAVHPVPPWPRKPEAWVRELAAIRQMLEKIPADDGPVVVAGDFNATFDHKRYRDLLGHYRDAAIEVGAGHLATYHADTWYPPVIAIDHVLVRDGTVADAGLVDLPGSDHRGIRATLLL
ncbi:endonuclease/exonuclease/phosphatase family protein [Rhodococcoides yunnanense]|uniref:endonuclease/exonuclease/phosphatase family protein n=1 Tax=Rhodococcoides yunnanense TaxID=278209 RepID=UPI0009322CFD|nr:endonuclease/exonuclease/phosphatase family protein [Rhodococcus yunnanensis]